jgi:hypothetical protein
VLNTVVRMVKAIFERTGVCNSWYLSFTCIVPTESPRMESQIGQDYRQGVPGISEGAICARLSRPILDNPYDVVRAWSVRYKSATAFRAS